MFMTEDKIRQRALELVRELGPDEAARRLGVARATVLSLAAGAPVSSGTLALVREHLRGWV